MQAVPVACPRCGQTDTVIKVTSPQMPRVLPITDAEIVQAARQLSPETSPGPAPAAPARPAQRSGCLVVALIIFGMGLFVVGAFYGAYHPLCASGTLQGTYPVEGLPVFYEPRCVDGDVVTQPEEAYVFPGGEIGKVVQWGGCALFLLGCVLPIVWWSRGRAERGQRRVEQAAANQAALNQQVLATQIGQARARVAAAYYCSRDGGFFIPGQPQFYPHAQWSYFLFG